MALSKIMYKLLHHDHVSILTALMVVEVATACLSNQMFLCHALLVMQLKYLLEEIRPTESTWLSLKLYQNHFMLHFHLYSYELILKCITA